MRNTLLVMSTVLASLIATSTVSANSSCPPTSRISKATYHFYMQGSDGSWRFDSTPQGAFIFVNSGKTKQEAAEAVKKVLQNLHPKIVKKDGPYCIYQGSLSTAEFWADSYPTVIYDTRN